MICKEVNISVTSEGMYVQGMDPSHVGIFELKLKPEWFTSYECKHDQLMGVNCDIISNILNCIADGQIMKWSYMYDSSEDLLIYFDSFYMSFIYFPSVNDDKCNFYLLFNSNFFRAFSFLFKNVKCK